MQVKYNVTGAERKTLVQNIALILLKTQQYQGAPTFAYTVGDYTIDKNGTLDCPDNATETEHLLLELEMRGFTCEREQPTDLPSEQPAEETIEEEQSVDSDDETGLTISLPRDGVNDTAIENLRRLVNNKASLIQKSLGADTLEVAVTDDRISFPWFTTKVPEHDVIDAFGELAAKLLDMAETQKRVNASEKVEVDNQKYAFRCFLLRLGFIGEEYKAVRKTLLRNMSGNGAFKNGEKNSTHKSIENGENNSSHFESAVAI